MERNGLAERAAINFKTLYSKSPICSRKLFLDGNQFDFVVIDEAQDFTYSPHDLCYLSLVIKGGLSEGKVVWIQDIHQSIRPFFVEYDMTGMPSFSPEELSYAECPLPPKNYRNPPGVVALAGAFNPGVPQKSLRESPQGNECEYVLCTNGKIGDSLDDVLTRLDQEGVKSSDIAIVTIDGFGEEAFKRGSLHSGHRVIKVPADKEQAVLRDNPDVIRAMNLLEAKGREFPVVILVDLPDMDKDHEHNFMHVAITRAKAKLFVICGPERMATLRKIAAGEA
jgi:superfamily I DNA and RNA helicase